MQIKRTASLELAWAAAFGLVASLSQYVAPDTAAAQPAGVPQAQCGTISNPQPGLLCYSKQSGGGKVNAGATPQNFYQIIQATEPEYVIADVVTVVTSAAGDRSGPTVNMLSRDGQASVVTSTVEKLTETKRLSAELKVKAATLVGPAKLQAEQQIAYLDESIRSFENSVTASMSAGRDSGKFQVTSSARSRSCGWANLDKCGSWVMYDIYIIKRYVGNPIEAYNRTNGVLTNTTNTINQLIAQQQAQPQPQTEPQQKNGGSKLTVDEAIQKCKQKYQDNKKKRKNCINKVREFAN